MLVASAPLKCTSPADIYLLLKSSDFIQHDLDPLLVFEGTEGNENVPYELELVLRKWYAVKQSRELRCFVRRERLLGVFLYQPPYFFYLQFAVGICQRDPNFYEFWNEEATQRNVTDAVLAFWERSVKGKWESASGNCASYAACSDL